MNDPRVHLIDDDLSEDSMDSWIEGVLTEVEAYLRKHAAFDAYLDRED